MFYTTVKENQVAADQYKSICHYETPTFFVLCELFYRGK